MNARQETGSAIYIMIFPCKLAKIEFSVLSQVIYVYFSLFSF